MAWAKATESQLEEVQEVPVAGVEVLSDGARGHTAWGLRSKVRACPCQSIQATPQETAALEQLVLGAEPGARPGAERAGARWLTM